MSVAKLTRERLEEMESIQTAPQIYAAVLSKGGNFRNLPGYPEGFGANPQVCVCLLLFAVTLVVTLVATFLCGWNDLKHICLVDVSGLSYAHTFIPTVQPVVAVLLPLCLAVRCFVTCPCFMRLLLDLLLPLTVSLSAVVCFLIFHHSRQPHSQAAPHLHQVQEHAAIKRRSSQLLQQQQPAGR